MMDIRKVPMAVVEGIVRVSVRVRLGAVPGKIVLMAMMLVVRVGGNVRQRLVAVQGAGGAGVKERPACRPPDRRHPERSRPAPAQPRKKHREPRKGAAGKTN